MNKCEFALVNVLSTVVTAAIEYETAPTEEEGTRRVRDRIKKNKTIESILDCALDNDSDCDCQ